MPFPAKKCSFSEITLGLIIGHETEYINNESLQVEVVSILLSSRWVQPVSEGSSNFINKCLDSCDTYLFYIDSSFSDHMYCLIKERIDAQLVLHDI